LNNRHLQSFKQLFNQIKKMAHTEKIKITKSQTIHCPNCGDRAKKYLIDNSIIRTSCEHCDYLLVQCSKTGKVIEAYAPGISGYSPISA
jgi:hypothetical protein